MPFRIPFIDTGRRRDRMIAITPLGQQKAESFQGGELQFRALHLLHTEGPQATGDLAKRLGIGMAQAQALAEDLTFQRWATEVRDMPGGLG